MRPNAHMYRPALATRKSVSRNRFGSLAGLLAALVVALLAACGDSTGPDASVASVSVSPSARTIAVGGTVELVATVKNRAGDPLEGRDVEWESLSPAVASVSVAGVVEGLDAGVATIVATSEGKRATARITVVDATPPPPAEVHRVVVDPAELVLPKYETRLLGARAFDAEGRELEGRAVSWTSDDADVATVDASGRVTARRPGWTRIHAAIGARSAWVDLTVSPAPVATIEIAAAAPEMDRGEYAQLVVRLADARGVVLEDRQVTWTSSDPRIVPVEASGMVHALADGFATITATSEGKSATVSRRVVPPPAHDLLFDAPLPDGGAQLFFLELGWQASPVKLNAGHVSRDPSPSPDGTRVAFAVSQRDLTTGAWQHDLYVVNVNGLGMRRLTSGPGVEQEPAWSPKGDRIAFSATDAQGRTDIWVVNADGSGPTNLTSSMGDEVAERAPAWSPDGARIAFSTTSHGIADAIWTMRADGSEKTRLVTGPGHGMSPSWSPDGTRIAFHHFSGPATGMDIAIVGATGGTATTLALPGDQTTPAWSPDGALIAFSQRSAEGVPQLWTMRPDGTGARMRGTGTGRNPAWVQ